jgi:flagellar hook-associated protein 1 FlgK
VTGTFFGLETALRALRAHQAVVDVTNHNIANANTPGYSRQTAELATTEPYTVVAFNQPVEAGQMGTGVRVAAIRRARDALLDAQYRSELSASNQFDGTRAALERIEAVFDEPSGGLSGPLTSFFTAWHDLTNNPADPAARAVLVQRSGVLAQGFNHAATQLGTIQSDLNDQVAAAATDANAIGDEIAALNRQIVLAEALTGRANDLRDRRDLALDRLAELVSISTTENTDGSVDVSLGAHSFVTGTTVDALTTTPTGPGGAWEVRFTSDATLAALNGGEMRALVDARDTTVPGYRARLDTLASDLIAAVNALHTTGYGLDGVTGRPFFAGADAATIAVDAVIAADPRRIGAADAPNQPANNAVALAIAQLQQTMTPTPEGAYTSLVATLGGELQATRAMADGQSSLVQLLDRRRMEVVGVSLDEEAMNLLRHQRAYEAAARLMTAMDQMLDKLINETGLVGR